ncbi:unnamed protein product [Enterobius vermicularis]|uniref:DUF148 domain-containing protein n=1 Tax=Enterobius vermicularis TaxID=51028 RepID=A0A158QAK8_ENTVE|nr:unnamed protein product [Enterobius vermicularis]
MSLSLALGRHIVRSVSPTAFIGAGREAVFEVTSAVFYKTMADEITKITQALETLERQYVMHKEKFEHWKIDYEKQRGSETYNNYVKEFEQWEAGVQEQRRQLIMEKNNIRGFVDVDHTLGMAFLVIIVYVLLAGVTFEDFMVAIATMTSKDKTFFRSLLSIYMSINSAGETRPLYPTFSSNVLYPANVSHPYSTPQYASSSTVQPAVPTYAGYSLPRSDIVGSNMAKRPFERNATVNPGPDKWKMDEPAKKSFRAPSPVKDYRNPSTLPFRDFSQT